MRLTGDMSDEPLPRSGHAACIWNDNYMIIYGGIYEVTKELNDMYVFDLRQDKWVCLFQEQNSPKKFTDAASPSPLKRNTMRGNENGMDFTRELKVSMKSKHSVNKSPSKTKKLRMMMLKPKEAE